MSWKRPVATCGLALMIGAGLTVTSYVLVGASQKTATPTSGTIPSSAWNSDGSIDMSQVPDYISVLDQAGNVVGYVARADPFPDLKPGEPVPSQVPAPQVVFASDLKTVVGHMYPGKGFVPLGTDPDQVPELPSFTSETTSETSGSNQ